MASEQELWAVALLVEKNRGADGLHHVANQAERLEAVGDPDGVAMWRKVAARLVQLDQEATRS